MNSLSVPNDIAAKTSDLLCAFKFGKSRRAGFNAVLSLAQKAQLFLENEDNGSLFYLVGFGKNPKQLALCFAFTEEIRVNCPIKYMVFAGGRLLRNKFDLLNLMSCAQDRERSPEGEAFCLDEYRNPITHFLKREGTDLKVGARLDSPEESHSWILPCKRLNGCLSISEGDLNDPLKKIEAVAEERLISICPHFYARRFEIREKAKQITRPKRYW